MRYIYIYKAALYNLNYSLGNSLQNDYQWTSLDVCHSCWQWF